MRGPAAAPSGAARAGGGGRRAAGALIYLFIPAQKKMDAIKITRGRTRRSQGAGDALGGPSPAAAGGQGGGRGDAAWLRSRRSCRPQGGQRGAPARWGRSLSVALGRRIWRGEAPASGGGDGGSGKGEEEAAREGGKAPLSPSPRRPHGTVRSSGREPQSNIKGAAGCAPGRPLVSLSRERHRYSAERIQPNRPTAPRSLHICGPICAASHTVLLERPLPQAKC